MKPHTWSLLTICFFGLTMPGSARAEEEKAKEPVSIEAVIAEITELKAVLAEQQLRIEKLQTVLIERIAATAEPGTNAPTPVESLAQPQAVSIQDVEKKVDAVAGDLNGFKFTGEFQLRFDLQARSGNNSAGPLQNSRGRYRIRFNVDKVLSPQFQFHSQLSTGPYNNQSTNDQDFAGMAVKHPFSIAEGWIDWHPNSSVSLRSGRMEEVWADNMRFLWDDNVRFNGFQQKAKFTTHSTAFNTVEFRSGEYLLSNPNIAVLPDGSPFLTAGYLQGQKVRDASLFDPGVTIAGTLGKVWSHFFTMDTPLFLNPNQSALSSTAAGFPVVVSNAIGLQLSGPITAVGNATTTPGGAIYSAGRFKIGRGQYRLENKDLKIGRREMPLFFDFQASRNFGTHELRDAMMVSVNLGAVKKAGDVRALYQFAIKDANSMIAQFTDDDLGTATTVNIATHAIRFDVGLTKFMQLQNLLFLQHERRPNNPTEQFFVPLQRGANITYHYLGQLGFTF
jgi:Putative porin